MPVSVVVLAAGEGKRMHSALPKVLQPLAGRPLLEHVLDAARALEPAVIHVVYGHGGDAVKATFGDARDLLWALQTERLGTGHAVMQAMPQVAEDHQVLVLCGDVPLVQAETLRRLLDHSVGSIGVLTTRVPDPTGYGRIVRDANGDVARICEHKDADAETLRIDEINTGLIAIPARELRRLLKRLKNDNAQGEYYLTDVIGLAVAEGATVRGLVVEDSAEVLGINDRAQLAAAERALQRRFAARLLAQGATLADPDRLDVRGSVKVGRDVFIDVGVILEGRVELGDGARIGAYSVIADSKLGAHCVVHPHSVLNEVTAADRCEIGPFARLRPGAALASRVKVGNFVELKNSAIAEGSKINHLTYVGDTTMGSGVNVGAGTITCNYDGANKHQTVIGDHAFIGSGVLLVAPIEVGEGATIGAGSTLTRSAPAGELTIARAKQVTIPGWKRPKKKPK